MDLIDLMGQTPELASVLPQLDHGRHLVTGLTGSAKTLLLATVARNTGGQLLVITNNRYHADELVADLTNLLGEALVWAFPVEDVLAAEVAVSSPDAVNERINTLNWLTTGQPGIVVTSLNGAKRLLAPKTAWEEATLHVDMASTIELTKLAADLTAMGYTRDSLVASPGQFAIRGGIIDVYPLNQDNPVRIELFDTEVDSLRTFNADNQRSGEPIESIAIAPATDLVADSATLTAAGERLEQAATAAKTKAKTKEAKQAITDNALAVAAQLTAGERPDSLGLYTELLYPDAVRLTDYMAPSALVVFDDYPQLMDSDVQTAEETLAWLTGLQAGGKVVGTVEPLSLQAFDRGDAHAHLYLSLFQKGMGNLRLDTLTNVTTRNVQQFFSQLPLLKTETARWQKQRQTVVFMVTKARVTKFESTLHDFDIKAVISDPGAIVDRVVQVTPGNLANGFELPGMHLVVVTEHELFNKKVKRKARHQTLANAERLRSYTELNPGDYVVHVNHGIGRYIGMQTMEVDGVHQDYITIDYQKGDQLFIPVTQLHLVQKYVAADGKAPRINKLGGSEWQKTKRKVASRIEDIADDLVKLYAAREAEPGFAYGPDDDLQRQFEAEFPYAETADQLRSAQEIKRDMQRARPMDRLLVGDVGFGKTEVALRAAFKAIESNKQVAILVPTTILAQQHYDTMVDRFADFPINVGLLSRFQTGAQIQATLKGLADGSVDIVVGTHRLLSKDVTFKDLGLLIVDEEQRFGVKHKEKIKALQHNVDVLTLTATPIPRTLNMSMLGVRDLSVIETPPTNRYPIQTFVMEQNAGVIRTAIEREMERGGQTFYLHNRVEDIERTVSELEQLVPEATIAYAHGQMTESQLEQVIYDFIHGAYDVLVTTTIIETGVDMPNVNTLIIENADRYGLSQLYQLRGRIGRSSRVAYAYFMYRPNRILNEEAEKRLQAIRDFTELGAGFKIAMRDLSIRGAGNLLGSQQHGYIDSVGYDLYTQMLQDAVAKRLGKTAVAAADAEVDLDVEAYLPDDYVPDVRQKIELYKRVRATTSTAEEEELQMDLIDRFGDYPAAVTNLLAIAHLKRLADAAQVLRIRRSERVVTLTLTAAASAQLDGKTLFEVLGATSLPARVVTEKDQLNLRFTLPKDMAVADWVAELTAFVTALGGVITPPATDEVADAK